jgi:Na+/H+-translocating membrane pyrophosphatase
MLLMNTGIIILILIISFILFKDDQIAFNSKPVSKYMLCITLIIGLMIGVIICYSTYYYTAKSFK